jgi:tRNA A-37 threonylcarbamoyl transferase component Bud32
LPPAAPPEASILPPPAAEAATLPPAGKADAAAGERVLVSGYEILAELGRGGMGVVYKARHSRLNRVVALKMILSGAHAGADDLARFKTEAEAIARLQHPNIVHIHEVGEHQGLPYLSLEFCPGSLDRKLNGTPLPPAEAASLVEALARAMHAAHQAHVVHRDLKPANVLLAADGTPKVTDFGLAKKLDEAGRTASGAVMGTPSYMAPEQAGGRSRDIGPAADVYALGAILYECLTGRPPFKAATSLDTLMQVVADEPVPPRQLQSRTPRDLETVCLKCLHKEPARRYATALDLAEDLRRFQANEPIQARPVGRVERVGKWMKRRPAAAGLLAVTVLGALLLLLGGLYFTRQLADERNTARDEKNRAEDREAEATRERNRAEEEKERAERQLDLARRNLMTAQLMRVAAVYEKDPFAGRELLHNYNACPLDLRDFAWRYYNRACQRDRLTLVGHTRAVNSLAFTVDGLTLASASGDGQGWGEMKLWDVKTGKARAMLIGHTSGVNSVAFSSDGLTLASGSLDKTVKLWDVKAGQERAALQGHTQAVSSVAFTADGLTLASASVDDIVNLWDVKLWDVKTGQERATLKGASGPVAFTADGLTLASGSRDKTVKLWDVKTGQQRATLQGHTRMVTSVAFSPDGLTLASGGWDGAVKLWDLPPAP